MAAMSALPIGDGVFDKRGMKARDSEENGCGRENFVMGYICPLFNLGLHAFV